MYDSKHNVRREAPLPQLNLTDGANPDGAPMLRGCTRARLVGGAIDLGDER